MDFIVCCLPPALGLGKLEAYLPAESPWRICTDPLIKAEGVLIDTFDEELLHADRLLVKVSGRLLLIDLAGGALVEQPDQKVWRFAADLDDGPVREMLAPLSPLRAFLPVAEVGVQWQQGALRDDEGKTGVRFNQLRLSRGRRIVRLLISETLRGYDQASEGLAHALSSVGVQPCPNPEVIYTNLGLTPRGYCAKPVVGLQADAPVAETAVLIVAAMIRVARANEPGIIADHDTEFLHDYRVSMRKIRSLLSLFRGVFDPVVARKLQTECADLMQETNRLRDLDVYLLEQSAFEQIVPPDIHQGLAALFDHIAEERHKAHGWVGKVMRSRRYHKRFTRLEGLFAPEHGLPRGPAGNQPSLLFAGRLVTKRYRKVCRIARQIDQHTGDETIHQLRIQCKKLRYLIEFFAPLFGKDALDPIVKPLKRLQDNLGSFNDASVQQRFLGGLIGNSFNIFSGRELEVAQAVGALRAMLYRRQQEERTLVEINFAQFDSAETRTALYQLFPKGDQKDEDRRLLQ